MNFHQSSTLELARRHSLPTASHPAPARGSLKPVVLLDDAGQPVAYTLRESTAEFMCSDDGAALQAAQLDAGRYAAAIDRMKALMSNMLEPRKDLGLRSL